MKFYVVFKYYLVSLSFKFHEDPCIIVRTRVVNARAHVLSRVRTFTNCVRAFMHGFILIFISFTNNLGKVTEFNLTRFAHFKVLGDQKKQNEMNWVTLCTSTFHQSSSFVTLEGM